MLLLILRCQLWLQTVDPLTLVRHHLRRSTLRTPNTLRDAGQATAEYALVMLGAAVVALLVVAWATAGGGAGKVGRLFDRVLDAVISRV